MLQDILLAGLPQDQSGARLSAVDCSAHLLPCRATTLLEMERGETRRDTTTSQDVWTM